MTATGPPTDCAVPPKSTLFCPECDHASPADGDWRLVRATGETQYVCPACDTEITSRPTLLQGPDGREFPTMLGWTVRMWGENVRTWRETVQTWGTAWQELGGAVTPG